MATALALGFAACSPSEEDDIFDHSAAERLNMISGEYSARLTDSKGGWVMEYYPYTDNENLITGVGYLIMNRFNSDGSVYTMMKNKASHNEKWEDTSSWEVITDMGPVLSYNTWNKCLGRFTDPVDIDLTTGRSEDESGKGFQGDYEFVMVDVPENGDHIMLKGKKRGVYQRLTRIPEGTDFETYLNDITNFKASKFVNGAKWEIRMTDHGQQYRINYADRGLATIYPQGKDSTAYGWHMPFMVTKLNDQYRLRFKDSVMVGNTQMEQEFVYDAKDDRFHGVLDTNNYIEGGDPYDFFTTTIENGGSRWEWNNASDMSDSYRPTFTALEDNFTTILGASLSNIGFRVNGKTLIVRFLYKKGRNNNNIDYVFEMIKKEGKIEFKFVKDNNTAAQNARERMPQVQEQINLLQQEWNTQESGSLFNLSQIKLVSASNPDIWFALTLK